MSDVFKAVKISDHVYWVGAVDWKLRDFHGYATERGSSYNAFLIVDEKVTLVDTVKAPFLDEMLARIASVVPVESIDYIVSNHAEMDHSGALPATIQRVQPEKVFTSIKGQEALKAHFHDNNTYTTVKDGETLSLGTGALAFYETRMLHWPDSMLSFYDADGILFSQDAFGMHLASAERFADEIETSVLTYEATKYFANILTPYSNQVVRQLDRVLALNLPLKIIAPDHGPAYRQDLNWVLELYKTFAAQRPVNKAVVLYDTMWGSTRIMADALIEGLIAGGSAVEVFPMGVQHRSNVATALLNAGAFIVGTPTLNNMLFPTIADVLTYVKGLRFKNLIGAAFGSYGWSGEAVKQAEQILRDMKVEIVTDSVRTKYVPTQENLQECHQMGQIIAAQLANLKTG